MRPTRNGVSVINSRVVVILNTQGLIQKILVGGVKQADSDYRGGPICTVCKAVLSCLGSGGMPLGKF